MLDLLQEPAVDFTEKLCGHCGLITLQICEVFDKTGHVGVRRQYMQSQISKKITVAFPQKDYNCDPIFW